MSQSSETLHRILRTIYHSLPPNIRRRFGLLIVAFFLGVCLETLSVGLLAYFAPAVSNPEKAFANLAAYRPAFYPNALYPQTVSGFLLSLSILTCLVAMLKNTYQCVISHFQAHICSTISGHFGLMYIHGLMQMPYVWHLRQNSSELVTIYAWRDRIGNDLLRTLVSMVSDVLLLLLLSAMLAITDPINFLFAMAVCPLIFFFVNKFIRPLIEKAAKNRQRLALLLNKDATSLIHGIKEVKLQGESSIISDISKQLDDFSKTQANIFAIQSAISPLFETIGIILLALIVIVTYNMASSPMKVMGTVALFTVVVWRGLPSISRVTCGITLVREALPTLKTFFDHIDECKKTYSQPGNSGNGHVLHFEKSISVQNISFRYEQSIADAIHNVSFNLLKGQTLGIVGASGSGKSTLVDMLIGLIEPHTGCVCIDGTPLTQQQAHWWRRGIGYVSQTPYISDDTLLHNIAFGVSESEIDRQWALSCCTLAHVDEFLEQLPHGLDSQIGERGACLSGGQRQRVAIARAFYKKPEILVFDEATSALDIRRERDIQETVLSLHGQTTMVIIAHRLSTVGHCDHILWLEKGVVKAFGSPQTVLAAYKESS